MNTRLFLLPLLFALCVLSGCAQPVENPVAEAGGDEKPKAGELPQAPPPHAKKTTAELLVGTWVQISVDGQRLPKTYETTLEITADGKACFRVVKSRHEVLPPPRVGEYRLDGMTITFSTEATTESRPQNWTVSIKKLDEDTLVISASPDMQGTEFVRMRTK